MQHRNLTEDDLNEPDLLHQLATELARFHAMKPPLPRNHDLITTFFTSSAKKLKESAEKYNKLFESYECKALLDCDMSSEVNWILESIPTFESPIVFSHNDFRFRNQMITEDKEVVLGDFEMSSYYCRGFDLAALFYKTDTNEEVIKEFITQYLKEGNRIFGKTYSDNATNSVDHILQELKQFTMVYSLFMANLFLHNDILHMHFNEKTCMVSHYTILKNFIKNLLCFSQYRTLPWQDMCPPRNPSLI